jgi:hypothetical protein
VFTIPWIPFTLPWICCSPSRGNRVHDHVEYASSYGEGGSICWCLCYGSPLRSIDDLAEEFGLVME